MISDSVNRSGKLIIEMSSIPAKEDATTVISGFGERSVFYFPYCCAPANLFPCVERSSPYSGYT